MSYIWIDFIAIAIVLATIAIGYFRGFFSSLLSLCGFIGSFVIAFLLKEPIVNLLESLFGFKSWFVGFLGESVGNVVCVMVAIVITYILLRVVIFILNHTIGKLFKGKVLGKPNAILGGVLGVVQGLFYVLIILVVWNLASLIPSVKTWTEDKMTQTLFVGAVYHFVGQQITEKIAFLNNNGENSTPQQPE